MAWKSSPSRELVAWSHEHFFTEPSVFRIATVVPDVDLIYQSERAKCRDNLHMANSTPLEKAGVTEARRTKEDRIWQVAPLEGLQEALAVCRQRFYQL